MGPQRAYTAAGGQRRASRPPSAPDRARVVAAVVKPPDAKGGHRRKARRRRPTAMARRVAGPSTRAPRIRARPHGISRAGKTVVATPGALTPRTDQASRIRQHRRARSTSRSPCPLADPCTPEAIPIGGKTEVVDAEPVLGAHRRVLLRLARPRSRRRCWCQRRRLPTELVPEDATDGGCPGPGAGSDPVRRGRDRSTTSPRSARFWTPGRCTDRSTSAGRPSPASGESPGSCATSTRGASSRSPWCSTCSSTRSPWSPVCCCGRWRTRPARSTTSRSSSKASAGRPSSSTAGRSSTTPGSPVCSSPSASPGLAVLLATLFNLITDLVGGVRFSVLEEEVQAACRTGHRTGTRRPGGDPAVVADRQTIDGRISRRRLARRPTRQLPVESGRSRPVAWRSVDDGAIAQLVRASH